MNNYPIKVLSLLLISAMLVACSSKPVEPTRYYLLNKGSAVEQKNNWVSANPNYVLQKVRLPDFLLQPNLMIQLNNNQLHYASNDVWAENLSDSIGKIITANLQNKGLKIHDHSELDLNVARLFIHIDHFYPTENSVAILAGKYWVEDPKSQKIIQGKRFNFSVNLEKDGYSHAVKKMNDLIGLLSTKLNKELLNNELASNQ